MKTLWKAHPPYNLVYVKQNLVFCSTNSMCYTETYIYIYISFFCIETRPSFDSLFSAVLSSGGVLLCHCLFSFLFFLSATAHIISDAIPLHFTNKTHAMLLTHRNQREVLAATKPSARGARRCSITIVFVYVKSPQRVW